MGTHVAVAETEIQASPEEVWSALTDPAKIEEYMFGSHVVTDWTKGGTIVWKGEYEGKKYEDRGEILEDRAAAAPEDDSLQPLERS